MYCWWQRWRDSRLPCAQYLPNRISCKEIIIARHLYKTRWTNHFFIFPTENEFYLLHHYKAHLLNLATEKMVSLLSHTNVPDAGSAHRGGWGSIWKTPRVSKATPSCQNEPGYSKSLLVLLNKFSFSYVSCAAASQLDVIVPTFWKENCFPFLTVLNA